MLDAALLAHRELRAFYTDDKESAALGALADAIGKAIRGDVVVEASVVIDC